MITSQLIAQQTAEYLSRGGVINIVDGFEEVKIERDLKPSANKKKKKGIGRALNSANEKSRAERESRVKAVCEMIEKNSDLSFRDLQREVANTYQVSTHAANTYIREARRMLND